MQQYSALRQKGAQLSEEIIRWRRAIHAMPELRMDTPKTEAYIAQALEQVK